MKPMVLNKYKLSEIPHNTVYIGRPSKWGNPFTIGKDGTREEVITKFRKYVEDRPDLIAEAKKELRGKNLLCFCAPLSCHGDVWLEIANEEIFYTDALEAYFGLYHGLYGEDFPVPFEVLFKNSEGIMMKSYYGIRKKELEGRIYTYTMETGVMRIIFEDIIFLTNKGLFLPMSLIFGNKSVGLMQKPF